MTETEGNKPAGKRLDDFEGAVDQLKISAAKWSMLIGAALALATLLPLSVWFTGILKQGEDGRPGIEAPIGSIVAWPGRELPKDDRWVVCNGGSVVFNSDLWDCLQGLHGNTEKGPTIQVPNYEGYFLRGEGQAETGEKGLALGEAQPSSIGLHTHGGVVQAALNGMPHTALGNVKSGVHGAAATGNNRKRRLKPTWTSLTPPFTSPAAP